MAGYQFNQMYTGGGSSLNAPYGNLFTGYTASAGELGMTTDPRTANVLKEVTDQLSSGTKHIEVAAVSPEVFESIPTGQLEEVKRIAKLTGAETTLHAPVIEPSGVGQNGYDETQRLAVERQMQLAIERAHELNPDGSAPVTFHSTAQLPGSMFKPGETDEKGNRAYRKMIAIDRESGQMTPLEEERLYYPEMRVEEDIRKYYEGEIKAEDIRKISLEEGKIHSPQNRLASINATKWNNELNQVIFNKERADEILQQNQVQIQHILPAIEQRNPEVLKHLTPEQKQALNHVQNAKYYLDDVRQHVQGSFHKAYKYGSEEERKQLENFSKQFQEDLKKAGANPWAQSQALQTLMHSLKQVEPKQYVAVEDFAVDKASETFSNVALASYKQYGDKAPIISIENPPAGGGLSTGEDLKNLVEATREKFVEKLTSEGVSKSTAQKQAEKLVGVTWDVGHINMLRKQGFETKDIVKETEKVAKLVKHVHLSDNFGMEHTELPMGMGNVPMKEIMAKLGKEGYDGKKVIEAVNWWQHFSPGSKANSPFAASLATMGAPIYMDGAGVGNYWNQATALQGNYMSGYGMMLPQGHFETFGAGFAMLPAELGGQKGGGQGSRMSGRPME